MESRLEGTSPAGAGYGTSGQIGGSVEISDELGARVANLEKAVSDLQGWLAREQMLRLNMARRTVDFLPEDQRERIREEIESKARELGIEQS